MKLVVTQRMGLSAWITPGKLYLFCALFELYQIVLTQYIITSWKQFRKCILGENTVNCQPQYLVFQYNRLLLEINVCKIHATHTIKDYIIVGHRQEAQAILLTMAQIFNCFFFYYLDHYSSNNVTKYMIGAYVCIHIYSFL